MKREFLKELGLTDEQIDFIMAENGKDVEAVKAKTTTAEAGKQIEAFKGMDIEGVKKSADEWKAKVGFGGATCEAGKKIGYNRGIC